MKLSTLNLFWDNIRVKCITQKNFEVCNFKIHENFSIFQKIHFHHKNQNKNVKLPIQFYGTRYQKQIFVFDKKNFKVNYFYEFSPIFSGTKI